MKICDVNIIGQPDTGAFIGLDDEGEALIKMLEDGVEFDIRDLTQNQTMLVNALDESGFFSERPAERSLKTVYFHVTSRCNLNCEGCYSYENERNMKPDMTLAEIKKILDNLTASGASKLIISGGEPFMRHDIIDILKYAKCCLSMASVSCITNGFAPAGTYLEAGQYLDKLFFSLDAHDDSSAAIRPNNIFNPVIEKVGLLKEAGDKAAIIFTLHKENLKSLDKMGALAEKLGVPCNFSFLTVMETNGQKPALAFDEEDYTLMYERIRDDGNQLPSADVAGSTIGCKLLCGAGRSTISISSDGGVYPCHMFNGYDEFLMGNSLHNDIGDILKCECNSLASMSVDDLEQCGECNARYLCGGGCRFRGYAASGNIKGHDKMCKASFASIENGIMRLLGY